MGKVKMKWAQPVFTEYHNHLNRISVRVMNAPTMDDLKAYIPEFVSATWDDEPYMDFTDEERQQLVEDTIKGKLLPTALETIQITVLIEGLDLIDVTHIIRHRAFSFSAQCTADRDMRKDQVMVKPSIIESEFLEEFTTIVEKAKRLYAKMVDSKEVSIFDARTILPRCMGNFYYMSGSLKDWIAFINTRKDEAIQPESDNVLAIRLYQALVQIYPVLSEVIKFGGRDDWFVKTALDGGHNSMAYMPKEENDVFDHKPQDFIYQKRRQDFLGGCIYQNIRKEVVK